MEAGADEGSSSMKVLSVVTVQSTVLRMISITLRLLLRVYERHKNTTRTLQ